MSSHHISAFAALNIFGAMQAFLMGMALLSIKRGNMHANRILGALSLALSIFITGAVLTTTRYNRVWPHLSFVHDPFEFCVAPLMFLYVRALKTSRPFVRADLLHFLPAVFCALYLTPYYAHKSDYKLAYLNEGHVAWYHARSALLLIQGVMYMGMLFRFGGLDKPLKERFLSHWRSKGSSQWKFVGLIMLSAWVVGVLRLFEFFGYTNRIHLEANLIIPFYASVLTYIVGYLALTKPEAVSGCPILVARYERLGLPDEQVERLLKKLIAFMKAAKPFKEGDLTIRTLAQKTSMPVEHLSAIINGSLHRNFTDFVNSYRVTEAKRLLRSPETCHYSVVAIGEEVGFNSKSAFNAAFKKHANMTPSDYRKAPSLPEVSHSNAE